MALGRKFRVSWTYVFNETDQLIFSPPPLDVNSTDSLLVHATNSIDLATTLHHHGMFFNSTPWMDGAKGVSEW